MSAVQSTALASESNAVRAWIAKWPAVSFYPENWALSGVVAAVILVNGFGEETGWRGFLTERLLPAHGRFRATLWVVWGPRTLARQKND